MGTIVKRCGSYRAIVRIKKHRPYTDTFPTVEAARNWIRKTEAELMERDPLNPKIKVDHLLQQYIDRILPRRKARMAETHWKRDIPDLQSRFAHMSILDFEGNGVIKWSASLDKKEKPVSASTRACYLDRLLGFFKQCETHFGTVIPWKDIYRCRAKLFASGEFATNNERDRRVSEEEIVRIKAQIKSKSIPLARIIDFCVASAMRIGEVTRIRYSDLNEQEGTIIIRDRKDPRIKIGNHKTVPLLGDSLRLLQEQREQPRIYKGKDDPDLIFPHAADYLSDLFKNACTAAGIEDCHLHDLRHEAISRLFEIGYQIHEVQLVSGHTSWKSLKRYTNLRPKTLAKKDRDRRAQATDPGLQKQMLQSLLESPQTVKLLTELLAERNILIAQPKLKKAA
jgi:integrase